MNFVLTLLVLSAVGYVTCQLSQHVVEFYETPTDFVISGSRLYSTTRNDGIIIFNSSLTVLGKHDIPGRNLSSDSLVMARVPGRKGMAVVCLPEKKCWLILPSNRSSYISSPLEDLVIPRGASLLSDQTELDSIVYIGGTEISTKGSRRAYLSAVQIKMENDKVQTFSYDFKMSSATTFSSRKIHFNFYSNGYVYFIATDGALNSASQSIKILRFCRRRNSKTLLSYSPFEVEIDCNMADPHFDLVGFSRIDDTVLLALSGSGNSAICGVDIRDVEDKIATALKDCSAGKSNASKSLSHEACADYKKGISECDFIPKGLKSDIDDVQSITLPAEGFNLLQSKNDGHKMTAFSTVQLNQTHQYVYIAFSSNSDHTLQQYLLSEQRILTKVSSDLYLPQPVLKMEFGLGLLYVLTTEKLVGYQVDNCHGYKDYHACITSGNQLCGWCDVQRKCSMDGKCQQGDLLGHLTSREKLQYIIDRSSVVPEIAVAADNSHAIKVVTGVLLNRLEYGRERISCAESNGDFLMEGYLSGTNIYCNFSNASTSALTNYKHGFSGKLTVVLRISTVEVTFPPTALIIHNCSLHTRCDDCLSTDVCGWCPYDHKCTGRSARCMQHQSWINGPGKGENSRCPMILPANGKRHSLLVGRPGNISLTTRNIFPLIDGVAYICKLQYSNGHLIHIPATYNHSNHVLCQIGTNQVTHSKSALRTGLEELELTLWMKRSDGSMNQIEGATDSDEMYISNAGASKSGLMSAPQRSRTRRESHTMTVYNCSHFSESCSLCAHVFEQSDAQCGWCASGTQGSCTASDSCQSQTFLVASSLCHDSPVIRSVQPTSGPNAGGTVITFIGTDLAVNPEDVEIKIENSTCEVDLISFQPVIGPANITIKVTRRGQVFNAVFSNRDSHTFFYGIPTVQSIFPNIGPMSGGTRVIVTGTDLNISDATSTMVHIAGAICLIEEITYSNITCLTTPSTSSTSGPVRIQINLALIHGDNFRYTENPQYSHLHPQHIIPAGGVILNIHGRHLNVSLHPRLEIYLNGITYSSGCTAENDTLLWCAAPKLTLSTRAAGMQLNYSIVIDGSPGPNISSKFLALSLRENPIFLDIHEDYRVYELFSEREISIRGQYLDSVQDGEINVTLLGEQCVITVVTSTVLHCKPPDFPILSDRNISIEVFVGNRSLSYTVGYLLYVRTNTTPATIVSVNVVVKDGKELFIDSWIFVVTISCASLSVVGLLVGLIVVICSASIKRRNRVLRIREPSDDKRTGVRSDLPNTENWYEFVSDSLVPNSVYVESTCANPNSSLYSTNRENGHRTNPQIQRITSALSQSVQSLNSVGSQQTYGLGREAQYPPHDEYVSMSSYVVSSNLSIATNSRCDRHVRAKDTHSTAEYVDMQPAEQGSYRKNTPSSESPTPFQNFETIV